MSKKTKYIKLLALIIAANTLTGCSEKAECNITEDHAHLYINETGFERYIEDERINYQGYKRQEKYIVIDEKDKKLYKFLKDNKLLRIEDNLDIIDSIKETQNDYYEYRYEYPFMMPIPHTIYNGKTISIYYTYIPTTHHSWTKDVNRGDLTGEIRVCHYVYYGYKIIEKENGTYDVEKSEYVDDIRDIMDEYPYIKAKYFEIVDGETKNILDYEDGQEQELTEEELENILNNLEEGAEIPESLKNPTR